MLHIKKKLVICLVFIIIILLFSFSYAVLDSDNDLVPDDQERLDGTDPENPSDNALFLNIEGSAIVGNTITLSIEHPTLGKIPDIDFLIRTKSKEVSLNSGSSGELSFKIENAGIHYITAQKNNFLLTTYFIPTCKVKKKSIFALPLVSLITTNFTNFIVALLVFLLSSILISATVSNLKKRQVTLFASVIGVAVLLTNYFLLFQLDRILTHISLFLEMILSIIAIWLLKTKGLVKKMLAREEKVTIKKPSFLKAIPIMLRIVLLRLESFIIAKRLAIQSKLHLKRALKVKDHFSKTKKRLDKAIESTASAETHKELQESMYKIKEEIERLNETLHKALAMKADTAQKEEKTLEEQRAEKKLELMIADIAEQLARELNVPELPETIELPEEKQSIFAKLLSKLKPKPKVPKEPPNICLNIYDEYNKALDATKAEFFIGSKKIEPIKTLANKAYFYFSRTVVELYTRYLGFVDSYSLIEPTSSLQELEVKMKPTLLLNIVDEEGNPLRDAFITILDAKGNKVEDVYKNSIWKTPAPSNAALGSAAIPLNPASLKYETIKVKIVRAGFQSKEIVIPSVRISTEEQYTKTIVLEKIAASLQGQTTS